MIYADLHCDTATYIYDHNLTLSGKTHINHRALKVYDRVYQCFAVFENDKEKIGGMEYFENVLKYFMPIISKESNVLPIITVEGGGGIIEGRLENLERLAEAGVKIFGLVWNGENELATGAQTNNAEGLKPLGIECLKHLERLKILPDVSHLSDKGFFDIAENYGGKIVATHSNARHIHANLRNLTDEEADVIIARNGLIGINLYPPFIAQTANVSAVLRHIDYFLSRGAENCLAFGCDLDGIDETPKGISHISDVRKIIRAVKKEYDGEIAEKIAYKNVLRVLEIGGERL